jgi:alcohol dehydrogenase
MGRTARAAVYQAPKAPFVIKHYPLRPAGPGEVLVRNTMSTICRSDIHSWEGKRPNPCPGILGHEIIGVIEELGAGMESDLRGQALRLGDRITWTEFFSCGRCYSCVALAMPQKCTAVRKYGHDLADQAPHFLGGFAEYCYIQPGTGILRLPDALSDEEATPLNCGVATMISVTEACNITLGDSVVVQGLGLLGLYGCAMAQARGARLVIGLDTVEDRLKMARHFGADETIDVSATSESDLIEAVRDRCRPDGADVVMEVCGVPAVIPAGLAMVRAGGRYTLAGLVNPQSEVTIDANVILKRWITLRGIHNYHPRHLIQALDFVMSHRARFPFAQIVDATFRLDQLDEAFRRAGERSVLRAAIVP